MRFICFLLVLCLSGCMAYAKPRIPIPFQLNSVPQSKVDAVKEAIQRWNNAMPVTIFELTGTSRHDVDIDDENNVIIWTKHLYTSTKNAIGVSHSNIHEDGFVACDIQIKSTVFGTPVIDAAGNMHFSDMGYSVLVWVIMHEMGHCLGLDHVENELDLMVPDVPVKVDLSTVPTAYDVSKAIEFLELDRDE